MNKIALAMICRGTNGEDKKLQRVLDSIAKYVDAIYITLTSPKEETVDTEAVCRKYNAIISYTQPYLVVTPEMVSWIKEKFGYTPHIQEGDKIFRFDEARNFSFNQIPREYEWVMWIDCDDIFRGGEKLRELLETANQQKSEAIYLNYLYHVELDELGNIKTVITQNPRERIIRNNCGFSWKGIIHEILTKDVIVNPLVNNDCDVVHLTTHEERIASLNRNIKAVEAALAETEGKDARLICYLAKLFVDVVAITHNREYDRRAEKLFLEFLLGEYQSEWEEERAQVYSYLAEIYNRNGKHNDAVKALMNGLINYPESRALFIGLATSYTMMNQWERALFWLNLVEQIPQKTTLLALSPYSEKRQILEIRFNCFYRLGKFEEARKIAEEIREFMPQNPLLAYSLQKTEQLLAKSFQLPS